MAELWQFKGCKVEKFMKKIVNPSLKLVYDDGGFRLGEFSAGLMVSKVVVKVFVISFIMGF